MDANVWKFANRWKRIKIGQIVFMLWKRLKWNEMVEREMWQFRFNWYLYCNWLFESCSCERRSRADCTPQLHPHSHHWALAGVAVSSSSSHSYSSWFDLHIGCNCGQRSGRPAGPALTVCESSEPHLPPSQPGPARPKLFSYFSCDSLPWSHHHQSPPGVHTAVHTPVHTGWLYTPSLPSSDHSANSYHLAWSPAPLASLSV